MSPHTPREARARDTPARTREQAHQAAEDARSGPIEHVAQRSGFDDPHV
jgi:hypothetical protein